MGLNFSGIQDQVITVSVSLGFFDRFQHILFLLFLEINYSNMGINSLVAYLVLTSFRTSSLNLQIFFESVEFRFI